MIAPIHPDVHSFGGFTVLKTVTAAGREDRVSAQDHALIEAIHQCFERDEEAIEQFRKKLAQWEKMDEPREDENYAKGVRIDPENGEAWRKPEIENFHALPDPDTEIDRTARLIVQGEYRRRAAEVTA